MENVIHWDFCRKGDINIREMWYGDVQVAGVMYTSLPACFLTPIFDAVPPELYQSGMVLKVDGGCVGRVGGKSFLVRIDHGTAWISELHGLTKVVAQNHVVFDGKSELPVGGAVLLNEDCTFHSVVLTEDIMNIRMPENGIGVLFYGMTVRGFKGCSQAEATDSMREFLPDRKIQAIKSFRKYTGLGLKESKKVVDRVLDVMLTYRNSAHYEAV